MARDFLRLVLALCLLAAFSNAASSHRKSNFKPQKRFDFHSSSSSVEFDDEETAKLMGTKFDYRTMSVCYKNGDQEVTVAEGDDCGGNDKIAVGHYRNAVNETGWGILELETFEGFEPEIQAYAAGVVEGILTKQQISYHIQNTIEDMCKGYKSYCKSLYNYLQRNLDWIRSEVSAKPPTDIYWKQVNLTYTQLTGIMHGYSAKEELKPIVDFSITPILMLQLSGELFDLSKFLNKDPGVFNEVDPGHCSGLVKITDGNKDLLMAHVSMSGFNTMNRVLKLYKFAYDKSNVPGHTYSFSSYPAVLASADDYTLTSAGLLSIETTISVFNMSLYTDKYIKPEGQLHCWVRSTIANQLANTGEQWVDIFARYNSGTYNNQWTVLDYKLFTPGKDLPNHDVLWVLEQVPGFTQSDDVTWFLRKYRYWPSYNIPYLDHISEISGYEAEGAKNNWYRWGYSPRAKIFQRDHHKVQDLETLKDLMRYNDYKHDELSRCNCQPPYTAEAAISTRGDLNPANGKYELPGMGHRNHGSLDYKGTNYELFKKLQIHAIGGPTYDPLPPFNWNTTDIQTKHYGQPTVWKFEAFITEWQTPVNVDMTPVIKADDEVDFFKMF